ncbi:MAG: sulfite exporter TauE/SafE family protein [Candidatus Gracilibacteria bacterium]|nr:sulfite exporter TauE/SafE family protein [Candidatus Gracilibacteria bacterium]
MPDLITLLFGFAAALVSSLAASFAGGGNSLVLFPLLLLLSPGSYLSLFASVKVSATVMIYVSMMIHRVRQAFFLPLMAVLVASSVLGTAIGTYLLQYQFDEYLFQHVLAVTLVAVSVYLLVSPRLGLHKAEHRNISNGVLLAVFFYCLGINILNGIFGGTGVLMTIFLVAFLRFSFTQAIAYAMFTYLFVNTVQTGYLLSLVELDYWLTGSFVLGSACGAWIGTHLQYLKGDVWVKRGAIVLMMLIGGKILLGG